MSDYIPHGDTALRLGWRFLPPAVRAAVEQRIGSEVVQATSCDAGFTPGFASVLTAADGSRHFVKAANAVAQQLFVDAYRREADVLAKLPAGAPAPRLVWAFEASDWFVFATTYLPGGSPSRPWRPNDLAAALDACQALARFDVSGARGVPTLAQTWAAEPAGFHLLAPGSVAEDQLASARELAGRAAEVLGGNALVHQDLRDDNLVFDAKGGAVLVDWSDPVVGPDWYDSLSLLIGPRGDGVDVDAVIAERPLLRDLPAETIDITLALWAGYFLGSASQPVLANSPHLRDAQWWQGEVCWNWLAARRGWPQD